MDMSRLQAFCAVVEHGSFTRAAKALFVTQPSISVKVQELESFYNVKLLERNAKRAVPTEAGMLVYEQGQKILLLADNIKKELARVSSPEEEILVGASSTIGNFALPCSVYLFKERYPDSSVNLKITNTDQVVKDMLNHSIKIGLVEGPMSKELRDNMRQEGINTRKIATHELVLTAPNNETWEGVNELSLKDLDSVPLIMREAGSGIRKTIEKTLMEQDLAPETLNVVLQLDSINAIISTVTANRGVSFLPRMAIRKELRYGILKTIKINQASFPHPFTLLHFPKKTTKRYHQSFVNLLLSKDRGFC